jgi:hypothetical protein
MKHETYDRHGNILSIEDVYPPVSVESVKEEAQRRIYELYPAWRQDNRIREGGDRFRAMSAYIDGVRAASDLLEASLPRDFTEDKYWPNMEVARAADQDKKAK